MKNTILKYILLFSCVVSNLLSAQETYSYDFKWYTNNDTLLTRITPCLENGKTAFVDILDDKEIAARSKDFIVMRANNNISPYWV